MTRADKPTSKTGRIVILTGAGISKESGLDTFRDPGGIWDRVRIEDVATPDAFARDPDRVHDFYNTRRRNLLAGKVRPNPAHDALARLEASWAGEVLLVTQNIDNLHERAGSRDPLHMHGEILKALCTSCQDDSPWRHDMDTASPCPHCGRKGFLRVKVVWFGEMPYEMERIQAALAACDLFLSIGTSGHVYPAAGFVAEVRRAGRGHTAELNLEPSQGQSLFAERIYGLASEIVPAYVEDLLGGKT